MKNNTPHTMPKDLAKMLSEKGILDIWKTITPLAKNEWICWIISPKQVETRERRLNQTIDKLKSGMRRPCCWAGCPHR